MQVHPPPLCFHRLSRVQMSKKHLHVGRCSDERAATIPQHRCYLHELTRSRQNLELLNVMTVLKNRNLISSPVRLECSSAFISMNMYQHLFLTFTGLTAEAATCFRIARGRRFLNGGIMYLSSLLSRAGGGMLH